jgi:hypothetical protein
VLRQCRQSDVKLSRLDARPMLQSLIEANRDVHRHAIAVFEKRTNRHRQGNAAQQDQQHRQA